MDSRQSLHTLHEDSEKEKEDHGGAESSLVTDTFEASEKRRFFANSNANRSTDYKSLNRQLDRQLDDTGTDLDSSAQNTSGECTHSTVPWLVVP